MAPSAVEPTTSALTNAGIAKSISKSAPSLVNGGNKPNLAELDASLLTITPTNILKPIPEYGTPQFAKCTTDHMITAEWTSATGWSAPHLRPYANLSLPPTASALHYATECFEGLKLYRGRDNKLRLFRPELNCARMLLSATRVALPAFPPKQLEKLIIALCARDGERWLPPSTEKDPNNGGRYLYIRPTMIGTDADIGVKAPNAAMLYIILTGLPDLAANVTARPEPGLRLLASEDDACRAWPGGFGYAKLGANYGPSLVAQREAAARGYDQILWLFGREGKVTEAGASNFFVIWKNEVTGDLELVTAPLEGKIILDGITRRSVIDLMAQRLVGHIKIVEREFTMEEVKKALVEERLVEAFSCGTAFFISPVATIGYMGEDLQVPMSEGNTGKFAKMLKGWLEGIIYGKNSHPWGLVVPEKK